MVQCGVDGAERVRKQHQRFETRAPLGGYLLACLALRTASYSSPTVNFLMVCVVMLNKEVILKGNSSRPSEWKRYSFGPRLKVSRTPVSSDPRVTPNRFSVAFNRSVPSSPVRPRSRSNCVSGTILFRSGTDQCSRINSANSSNVRLSIRSANNDLQGSLLKALRQATHLKHTENPVTPPKQSLDGATVFKSPIQAILCISLMGRRSGPARKSSKILDRNVDWRSAGPSLE
jgi:hypothetical protein